MATAGRRRVPASMDSSSRSITSIFSRMHCGQGAAGGQQDRGSRARDPGALLGQTLPTPASQVYLHTMPLGQGSAIPPASRAGPLSPCRTEGRPPPAPLPQPPPPAAPPLCTAPPGLRPRSRVCRARWPPGPHHRPASCCGCGCAAPPAGQSACAWGGRVGWGGGWVGGVQKNEGSFHAMLFEEQPCAVRAQQNRGKQPWMGRGAASPHQARRCRSRGQSGQSGAAPDQSSWAGWWRPSPVMNRGACRQARQQSMPRHVGQAAGWPAARIQADGQACRQRADPSHLRGRADATHNHVAARLQAVHEGQQLRHDAALHLTLQAAGAVGESRAAACCRALPAPGLRLAPPLHCCST